MNDAFERVIEMVRRGEVKAAEEFYQRLTACSAAEAKQTIESVKAALARPLGKKK